jgi:UDP-glucose 4-epimerase
LRFLVTGATGFLGSRSTGLLLERGHELVALARPGAAERALSTDLKVIRCDAGDPAARDLIAGCDVVLHFAGVPDPARAQADPARAVRENVGTTLNLLEGCRAHGAGLVYPSTVRAATAPPPDAYALSKRLGEEACRLHPARSTVIRLTSVFGPGQVAWEGATGAIARFASCAFEGEPIVIPGDPDRERDFVYVDDVVAAFERIIEAGRWGETVTVASGVSTSLLRAAELVRAATGSHLSIETPGGELAPGENESYTAAVGEGRLAFDVRPLDEGISRYVDWLSRHPAAQGRPRA